MFEKKISTILIFLVILIFSFVLVSSVFAVYKRAGHWFAHPSEFCDHSNINRLDDDSWKHEPGRPWTDQVEHPSDNICRDTALTVKGQCYNDERREYRDDWCFPEWLDPSCKGLEECLLIGDWWGKDYTADFYFECPDGMICWDGKCEPKWGAGHGCTSDCYCASGCCSADWPWAPSCRKLLGESCVSNGDCCTKWGHLCWKGKCIASCNCAEYGEGWYDPSWWGGCSDCNKNSTNNCSPCKQALAYCDGCLWNTTWDDFKDETYTGTGPGHKCPGNPKICTPKAKWCVGQIAWTCSDDGCTKSSQDCGPDNCSDSGSSWYAKEYVDDNESCLNGACVADQRHWDYCDGNINHDRRCSGADLGADATKNCNDFDGTYDSVYRDYYCSDGACAYTEINQPPSIPNLIAPSNNIWINYNPTFQASATDPDGDKISVWFEVTGYGSDWGSEVGSGGTSSWGPRNVGNCFSNSWRGYAKDSKGATSNWSGSWLAKVDKDNPISSIDYPTGTYTETYFTVKLGESDGCSGINQGYPQVKSKPPAGGWTGWQDIVPGTGDIGWTGLDGYSYQFRYKVKDNANNESGYATGGIITIDLNDAPITDCDDAETWNYCAVSRNPKLEWTYSDPDGDPQESYQLQIDNESNFFPPVVIDTQEVYSSGTSYQPPDEILNWNIKYYWRVKVKDNKGSWSIWCSPICSFTPPKHAYPDTDFSWKPLKPSALQTVKFTDETEFDNGAKTWNWTFENANPGNSSLQNPVATFSSAGNWDVTLEATDSDGYVCPKTHTINVSQPLPEWREVKPK